ncbi:penicillin-binding protein [Heyndrickxia shackletonii]|uniref:serine-type D-Ala-D-Ala carboxypeptidase n=1 Tax=Heyndrickxia shackletonii TaxID=157838 RepID=A0A0Q3WZA4_9BACI|nr:penicillin-binding protein [Heyndrickxia shackletonii]KQL54724.1 penicillin-binding protein [Heyndrickxia shackletonii]NEY98378.1 penicillin-binding protein [Heyndrickxia shackletonii]
MNKKRVNINRGAGVLFLIFGLLFFIIIVRFFTIQVSGKVDGVDLAAKAAKQYLQMDKIKANRGTIYDDKGEIIAEDTASYTLGAILDKKMTTDPKHPHHVVDPQMTAEKLSQYIDMPEEDIYKRLTKKGPFQVEFGKAGNDISLETKKKIEALKLPGIIFIPGSKRFYPNGIFASHLIGYVSQKNPDDPNTKMVGKMGLEQSFDKYLQGTDGKVSFEGDLWGYLLPGAKKKVQAPKNGDNIYLTIDKKIQIFIEDALSKVEEKYKPKNMIAIVADPKTGKILGMGQRPTFDPMTRDGIEKAWSNQAVETSYEPGSVMKIFTLAAAVQQGVFNPNAQYKSGTFYVKGVPNPIRDWNYGAGWGTITFLQGLQRSSNVAFATLLDKIGQDTFRTYLDRFHFGQPTNIGLPNEASGKILYNWPIERYTTTFGQGTTVTGVQMIQAATAIANNGKMMKPYVVDKIVDPNNGEVKKTKPEIVGNPVSAATAKQVRNYLRTVVTAKDGTGKLYEIPGYDVTGKTGTAQIPGPDGKYLKGYDDYIFSFLGMAPKDDPKLIVYVAVQQPQLDEKNYESGSVPVQMIFNPVMKNSLQYLNIKPAKMTANKVAKVPNVTNMNTSDAQQKLKDTGLQVVVLGKGTNIVGQLPAKGTVLIQGEKIFLKTDNNPSVPNMTNWSKRDVMNVAKVLDLKLNMIGDGYVWKQNITPNSPIQKGDLLVVNLLPMDKLMEKQAKKTSQENKNKQNQNKQDSSENSVSPPLD